MTSNRWWWGGIFSIRQRNLANETREILLKYTHFTIYLSWSLTNHVYYPCHERPPVSRDHIIQWSLYPGIPDEKIDGEDSADDELGEVESRMWVCGVHDVLLLTLVDLHCPVVGGHPEVVMGVEGQTQHRAHDHQHIQHGPNLKLTPWMEWWHGNSFCHVAVMAWERFSQYWPFMKEIHWWLMDYPSKGPIMQSLEIFFCFKWNKLLKNQWSWRWF